MIPIPNVNHPTCFEIMNMVDKVQKVEPDSHEYGAYIKTIDTLVYQLYGLSDEEIRIIERQ